MALQERASVCTLDCPDTCSLEVTVDEGRITKVRGSKVLPLTAGAICNKVAHHTATLRQPRAATWTCRSWDPPGRHDRFPRTETPIGRDRENSVAGLPRARGCARIRRPPREGEQS